MNNKHIHNIYILDDNTDITNTLREIIDSKIPNCNVYGFSVCEEMLKHPDINKASLFIIDIELNSSKKGNEIAEELFLNKLNIPYLFISGKNYEYECFSNYDYTYDFIKKPFDINLLINRVKVLLKVSDEYERNRSKQSHLQLSIKELFDYTNIYMLILDTEMKIKACSYKLGKDLGFDHENEIIGLNWETFLKEKDIINLKIVFKNIIEDTEKYQKFLREVTNKIITKSGTTISVKWFNSRIVNGNTYTFSIGIPYNRTVSPLDDIESIRAYWKHVLDKDDTTLKALKNVI